MKTVIACLLMVSALLSGCIVEPVYRGDYRGGYGYRDRDHDGVPNRPAGAIGGISENVPERLSPAYEPEEASALR